MIVFVLTEDKELRIVKADTTEKGIEKAGGRICSVASTSEELFSRVIDKDFILCVSIWDRVRTHA